MLSLLLLFLFFVVVVVVAVAPLFSFVLARLTTLSSSASFYLLLQIKLDKRKDKTWDYACALVVDGVDCPIREPVPFDRAWYSHKFNGAGLHYKLATSIQTGLPCWMNGPFQCGVYSSNMIFQAGLLHHLPCGKIVQANCGYQNVAGEPFGTSPPTWAEQKPRTAPTG